MARPVAAPVPAPATSPAERPVRVAVRDLVKSYGRRRAVQDVSFELTDGVTALLGPNGAGKSTIIRCLAGILDWDAGQINIDGVDADGDPRASRARLGYLPERVAFPPELTVRAYLNYAAAMKGVARRRRAEAVDQALARIDLEPMAQRIIGNLSKGYRQRVGLAQALIGDPKVLVLDEPMAGLDPLNVWDVRHVLWEYGREHTVLLSTHVLPEARMLSEAILVVAAGRVIFDGSLIDAELTGSVTRRWRLGVRDAEADRLSEMLGRAGVRAVHRTANGTGTSLVVDAETPAAMDDLTRAILAEGWSLAHFEPMTDLIDSAFREAGLRGRPCEPSGAVEP